MFQEGTSLRDSTSVRDGTSLRERTPRRDRTSVGTALPSGRGHPAGTALPFGTALPSGRGHPSGTGLPFGRRLPFRWTAVLELADGLCWRNGRPVAAVHPRQASASSRSVGELAAGRPRRRVQHAPWPFFASTPHLTATRTLKT